MHGNDCCGNDVTQNPEFMPRVIKDEARKRWCVICDIKGYGATSPTRRDALARLNAPGFLHVWLKRLIEYMHFSNLACVFYPPHILGPDPNDCRYTLPGCRGGFQMHDQTEAVGFLLSKLKLNGPTWEMIERSQREDERAERPYRDWTCSTSDLKHIPLDAYLNRPANKKVNNSMKTFDIKYEPGYAWWLRWNDGSAEMLAFDAATLDPALDAAYLRWCETLASSEDTWSDGGWHTVTA